MNSELFREYEDTLEEKEEKQKLEPIKQKTKNYIWVLYPVLFLSSVYVNILSFYLSGNSSEQFRKIFTWGLIAFLLIIVGAEFLFNIKGKIEKNKRMAWLLCIPLGYYTIILSAFLLNGNSGLLRKTLILGTLYLLPMFFIGFETIEESKFLRLISSFKWHGLILLPAFVMFVCKFFAVTSDSENWNTFAGISYLNMAYAAWMIMGFTMLDIMIVGGKEKTRFLDYVLIGVCTMAIMVAGSRGVMLAMGIWLVAYMISVFFRKKNRARCITAIIISIICVGITIVCTPEEGSGLWRVKALGEEIKKGDLEKAYSSGISNQIMEMLDESAQKDTDKGFKDHVEDLKKSEANLENAEFEEVLQGITNGSMSRVLLYKLAIREANKRPLTGMGPMGFQLKYNTYPHNMILEILSDFGYPICALFVFFLLWAVVSVFRGMKKSRFYYFLFMQALAMFFWWMLSVNLYIEPGFVWIVTCFLGKKIQEKQEDRY